MFYPIILTTLVPVLEMNLYLYRVVHRLFQASNKNLQINVLVLELLDKRMTLKFTKRGLKNVLSKTRKNNSLMKVVFWCNREMAIVDAKIHTKVFVYSENELEG